MKKPWNFRPSIWLLLRVMRGSDWVLAVVIWVRWQMHRMAGGSPLKRSRCPMCGSRLMVLRNASRTVHCWSCSLDAEAPNVSSRDV